MAIDIYWFKAPTKGKLGTMSKPRGEDWLEGEVQELRNIGIDVLVSLLTYQENIELGLTEESRYCQESGIDFISYPVEDRKVPTSYIETSNLINNINIKLNEGKNTVVHCRAGIGRSSIIAALILMKNNITAIEAFKIIEKSRGLSVPDTQEQFNWVRNYKENINY